MLILSEQLSPNMLLKISFSKEVISLKIFFFFHRKKALTFSQLKGGVKIHKVNLPVKLVPEKLNLFFRHTCTLCSWKDTGGLQKQK